MNDDASCSPELEYDKLPPVRQLILDVLAARYRLAHHVWTFPTTVRKPVELLEQQGLVWWKHGVMPKTILVGLTAKGKLFVLSPDYFPPTAKPGVAYSSAPAERAMSEMPVYHAVSDMLLMDPRPMPAQCEFDGFIHRDHLQRVLPLPYPTTFCRRCGFLARHSIHNAYWERITRSYQIAVRGTLSGR